MKKLTLLLLVLCIGCLSGAAQVISGRYTTIADALYIAKERIPAGDYDYYDITSSDKYFTVLVDEFPTQPWKHQCYVVNVPTLLKVNVPVTDQIQITHFFDPGYTMVGALDVKNRMGANATMKPHVAKNTDLTQEDLDVAARTYAVIINMCPATIYNTERYWNDCSLVYQMLAHRYGVPKANIYPLMSDGADPAADMRAIDGTIKSQSLDLDFDGNNEIQLAATPANINSTLASLASKLNEDDHLFVYVTGYCEQEEDISYLSVGKYKFYEDSELAEALKPFAAKYVNIDVLLAPVAAKGFLEKLGAINGCVVCALTGKDANQQFCDDIPYTRFTYDWAQAMIGNTRHGEPAAADTDGNGRITVREAFDHAAKNSAACQPMYKSNPESVGEDLAFNHLAPAVDLYIKDNYADTGVEPNLTTNEFWKSPSIWIRNNDDWGTEHENPYYSSNHFGVWMHIKIHNRGKKNYNPDNGRFFVHGYWSKASTCITEDSWRGQEVDDDGNALGFYMGFNKIPGINAGDSTVVRLTFTLPSLDNDDSGNDKFCLFAKVRNKATDPIVSDGKPDFNPYLCNDHAQLNTIIKDYNSLFGEKIYVRNPLDKINEYSLELRARRYMDSTIFAVADVDLRLASRVYDGWAKGGYQTKNVNRMPMPDWVRFVGNDNRIDAIKLNAREFDKVTFSVKFNSVPTQEEYICDLIQRDSDGKIVGGETFIIKAPQAAANALNITEAPADNGRRELVADMEGFATVRWKNSRGEDVGDEAALNVLATPGNNTFKAIAMTADGKIAVSDYTIETVQGIEAVSAVGDNVTVQLSDVAPAGASITIGAASGLGEKISAEVPAGAKELSISAPGLVNGINAVTLSVDDEKIDSKKFVK